MNPSSRPLSPAEIDAVAADWIVRREGGWSDPERGEFERWRASDPRHHAAVERLDQAWTLLERPRDAGRADEMVRALAARAQRRRRRTAAVALACVGLFAAGVAWQSRRRETDAAHSAAVLVMPEKRVLPDGGTIELKPGAEVAVDYSGELRRVALLRGEALFHVAENKQRPFVVTAGGVDVRAVGTAFLVALGGQAVDVVVTHGRVAVEKPAAPDTDSASRDLTSAAPSISTLVDAGNRVMVERTHAAVSEVMAVSAAEMTDRLAWCGPRVEFTDTALGEAVALINRHSRLRLVVADPVLAKLPVNGLFRVDNTETLVRLLEAGFGVEAERSGDTITLRRRR